MNLYHTWIYEYVLNAKWFIWVIVYTVLALNVMAPVIIWGLMNGTALKKWGKMIVEKTKKENEAKESRILIFASFSTFYFIKFFAKPFHSQTDGQWSGNGLQLLLPPQVHSSSCRRIRAAFSYFL